MIDLHAELQKLQTLNRKREARLLDCAAYVSPLNNLVLMLGAREEVLRAFATAGSESWSFGDKEGAPYLYLSITLKAHDWAAFCDVAREVAAVMTKTAADRREIIHHEGPGEAQMDATYNSWSVHRRVDVYVRNRAGHVLRFTCTLEMPQQTKPAPVNYAPAPVSGVEALKQVAALTDAEIDGAGWDPDDDLPF